MLGENTVILTRFLNLFDTSKKEKTAENKHLNELKARLNQTKLELNAAIENFNNVTDPKLIDVYIYKIQSEEARYEHILNEIKSNFL